MRILALKPKGRVLPFIHGAMVEAFKKLRVGVESIPIPDSPNDFLWVEEKIKKPAQVIFTLNMGADQDFIAQIKEWQIKYRQPWIIWFVDDPEGYNFPQACEPTYTLAFCWDRGLIKEMTPILTALGYSLDHLPLAVDPEVFCPEDKGSHLSQQGVFAGVISPPNELYEKIIKADPKLENDIGGIWKIYKQDFSISLHDLLWGKLAQELKQEIALLKQNWLARLWVQVCVFQLGLRKRREVVARIFSDQGAVFGDERWAQILNRDIYRGQIDYGKELNKIYNNAAFVLDLRPAQSRTGLTQRVFDASASGVPVLTEWSPELEILFDPRGELYYFRSGEEVKQVRDLIIRDKEKAKRKAEKARARTLRDHTYLNRARLVLEKLRKF